MTIANVVAWNLKVGRRVTFPNELASLPHASVYAFNECGGHWDDLDRWSNDAGLAIITSVGDVGSNSALFLSAKRVEIVNGGVEIVDVEFRGPKGKRIPGRSIVWALVRVDDVPLFLVLDHGPWNPVLNFRAWRAYQQRLRRMGTWFPSVDMLLVGDHNQSHATRAAWAIRGTANAIRARLVPGGGSVDFAIHRPGRFKRWAVTTIKGARMFSDHAYYLYRLVSR